MVLMSESVKVFRCRPRATLPHSPAAGVGKPPMEETAVGELCSAANFAVCQASTQVQLRGDGMNVAK
jgi:hypothetical protein